MKFQLIGTFVFIALLSACSSPDDVFTQLIIEQDGLIQVRYLEEIEALTLHAPITTEDVEGPWYYAEFSDSAVSQYPTELADFQLINTDNNGVVDVDVYGYVIEIPVRSTEYIQESGEHSQLFHIRSFIASRCDESDYLPFEVELQINQNPSQSENSYHYKAVVEAGALASQYLLNHISDICLVYTVNGGFDQNANVLRIPADDLKSALNSAGILHE